MNQLKPGDIVIDDDCGCLFKIVKFIGHDDGYPPEYDTIILKMSPTCPERRDGREVPSHRNLLVRPSIRVLTEEEIGEHLAYLL